jgi:phosphoribosylformimino-5-aminoimidazole carboxamide ribotide isomerase
MIQIIPSLAVIGGKCVRLQQGNFNAITVYDKKPLEFAQEFEDNGITMLHLIDLEGSKAGKVVNLDTLYSIVKNTKILVDFGGGITEDGELHKVFEYGASMATVGSLAVTNKALFSSWLVSFGRKKLRLSADALNGKIHIKGWQKATETDLMELIADFYERGGIYLKCSDISKDGLLAGTNLELYKQILQKYPSLHLTASGGVSSIDDIKALEQIGVKSVIVGKAIYENKISLSEINRLVS